mmetsp:Transcript_27521/g.107787  ORF Transcript_27521/g.107787 Transcript_27521/m.107787 type:complete len:159 (+) Transcript_27521:47-523(+)
MEEVPGEIEGTEPERRWSFRTVLRCMLAGLGMFAESYFIFTTGQMHGIWRAAYPECWASDESDPVCLSNSDCPQIFGDGGQEVPDSAVRVSVLGQAKISSVTFAEWPAISNLRNVSVFAATSRRNCSYRVLSSSESWLECSFSRISPTLSEGELVRLL